MPATPSSRPLAHLSVFALERATGNALARVPFYAEIGLPAPPPPAPVVERDGRFDDGIRVAIRQADPAAFQNEPTRERLVAAVDESLSRLLPAKTRDRLAADGKLTRGFLARVLDRAKNAAAPATLGVLDADTLRRRLDEAVLAEVAAEKLPLDPEPAAEAAPLLWAHPLGILATDHVGYLSFDLTRLPSNIHAEVAWAVEARRRDPKAALNVAVWLYPLGRQTDRVDALAQGRFAPDAILVKLDLERPELPAVLENLGLLAMQKPDLTDWRFSPASFAANPGALVGQDGCETLLPANVALQEFYFYQVIRLTNPEVQANVPADFRDRIKLGIVQEYRLAWYPLGHSLGQILYSLPLAPGESVNLAVIDWTRRDDAQRKEHTTMDEQLVHNEHRDRTISETVNAAVHEYQHGSSFMGGIAGALGGSYGAASGGLAGSLGGSTSSSSGTRDVAASTAQKLSDNVSQASSAMRELQSTVVVHSVQAEKEAIETRTVVNYNHSHALTILYYEVLRHFRVATELVRRRPAALVKIPPGWLDLPAEKDLAAAGEIRNDRKILEAALLDPRLADNFNALDRIAHRAALAAASPALPAPPLPGEREFIFFTFEMLTGGMFMHDMDDHAKRIDIVAKLIGPTPAVNLVHPEGADILNQHGAFRQPDAVNVFVAGLKAGQAPVKWKAISALMIFVNVQGASDQKTSFRHIKVTATDTFGGRVDLVDQSYDTGHFIVTDEDAHIVLPTLHAPPPPAPAPRPVEEIEDEVKRKELQEHLRRHKAHYARALALNQNPADRAQALDAIKLPGGKSLLDQVESRPLEIIDDSVAYPCTDETWSDAALGGLDAQPRVETPLDERLVTLPTRGVFAEAKLGHCNASEEIDNTRFWDWQQSPVPHLAPEIAPITGVTPHPEQPNLAPTPFPSPIVNIVNPPNAPDPTGLAAAIGVLGTPGLFRDMSGRAEVADVLKNLADNAVKIAGAANVARSLSSGSGSGGGGTGPGAGPRARATEPSAASRDMQDMQHVLENAQQRGLMTPEQAQDIYQDAAREAFSPKAQLAFSIGAAAASPPDPGNFKQFVDANKLDLEIADVLRALDGYPQGSWAQQTAAFAFHELQNGNLFAIVKAASVAKVKALIPAAHRAQADVEAAAVGFGATVYNIGILGALKGYTLLSDALVANGIQPGSGREFLALVIAHELTHFRNRDYYVKFDQTPPASDPTLYVDLTKANAHTDTQVIASRLMQEIICRHVAWRVKQDLVAKRTGVPPPGDPNKKRFFAFALQQKEAGHPDNGYLADLVTAGKYNQQVAEWLREAGKKSLFHDDATINAAVRQFFEDTFTAVQPAFATPTVAPDGGA